MKGFSHDIFEDFVLTILKLVFRTYFKASCLVILKVVRTTNLKVVFILNFKVFVLTNLKTSSIIVSFNNLVAIYESSINHKTNIL